MSPIRKPGLLAPAGLVVGPALWAACMQVGQILPYDVCRSGRPSLAILTFVAALGSIGGSFLSWRASVPDASPRGDRSAYPATFAFVGRVAALAGLIFAFALTLQGLSALVLSGCER